MWFSLGEGRICGDPQTHPDELRARPRSCLTFGNRSDWSQNVRAAGGCSLRLNGRDYDATRPELLSLQEAQPPVRTAFSPLERASFGMLGIRQVMRLHVVPAEA
jgi:hypothetical protein